MNKPHLIIDVALCQGCNNCFLACKDEHVGNDWPGYTRPQSDHGERWIQIPCHERGQYPHHRCGVPADALHPLRRRSLRGPLRGGHQQARRRHRAHRPGEGRRPRRPGGGLSLRHDLWSEESQRSAEMHPVRPSARHRLDQAPLRAGLRPGRPVLRLGDRPRVRSSAPARRASRPCIPGSPEHTAVCYKNLARYDSCFIAGSVAVERDGIVDCASGRRGDARRRPPPSGPPMHAAAPEESSRPSSPTLSATSSSTG